MAGRADPRLLKVNANSQYQYCGGCRAAHTAGWAVRTVPRDNTHTDVTPTAKSNVQACAMTALPAV
jgi:hypothetical protein